MKIKFLDDFKKKLKFSGVLFDFKDFRDKYFSLSSELTTILVGEVFNQSSSSDKFDCQDADVNKYKLDDSRCQDLLRLCYCRKVGPTYFSMFFSEEDKVLSLSEGHAREATKKFVKSLSSYSKEIEEDFNLPFDELKNMFNDRFKEFCEEHGENKCGELYWKDGRDLLNMRWYPKEVYFVKLVGSGAYKAVYLATIIKVANQAYVNYMMDLDYDIFTKKRADRIKNCFYPQTRCLPRIFLQYRDLKQEYNFLTSQIMKLAISLAEQWNKRHAEPASIFSLLHRCDFRELDKYRGLEAVLYPIKQEGVNFYDYKGNLVSYEVVSLHYLLRKFVNDLVMMSNDPILPELKKEFNLGFNELKEMFGSSIKQWCEDVGENSLGEHYYMGFSPDFWPKGICFYKRSGAGGYEMVFRDKLNDLTEGYFDQATKSYSFFRAGYICPA